jgi:hypothetical protein
MTIAAKRSRLHDYIKVADDKKIEAIYTLLEDQIAPPLDWSEDAEFIAELEDRINKYNSGIEEAYTIDEAKLALSEMKAEYIK